MQSLPVLLLLAAGVGACGPAAPLPNSLVTQLAVTGGTFIFSTGDAGSPDNPRWCPEPAGTPCETMGAFQSGASNDTYYVFIGDTCQSGGSWQTNVQVQCMPGTIDTLVSAQRNTAACLATYVLQSDRACDVCSSPPCGPVAVLPELFLELHVPGGTYIFESGQGDPSYPRYCPEPPGTPCLILGYYNAAASTAARYVFEGGDTCKPGVAWQSIVQFSCSPGAADTLAAAQLDDTACVAKFAIPTGRTCVTGAACSPPPNPPSPPPPSPAPPHPPRPPPRPCAAMQLDPPGGALVPFSSGGLQVDISEFRFTRAGPASRAAYVTLPGEAERTELGGRDPALSTPTRQVYRNGQVCNNQSGALWGAVAAYQCKQDILYDAIVAARVSRKTCSVSIIVATPRACTLQCTPPPPSGKRACGVLQMPRPAGGQAVLNVSSTPDASVNFTLSYFAPASAANSVSRACARDARTRKIVCLSLGKLNTTASTPGNQVFDREGDFCDRNKTRRYTTDATWVCAPGLRRDKLVPIYVNEHTCRASLNVLSARACVTGVRCPSPPAPPPRPRPPPQRRHPPPPRRRPPPPKKPARGL